MVEVPKGKHGHEKDRKGVTHPFSLRSSKLTLPPNVMIKSAIHSWTVISELFSTIKSPVLNTMILGLNFTRERWMIHVKQIIIRRCYCLRTLMRVLLEEIMIFFSRKKDRFRKGAAPHLNAIIQNSVDLETVWKQNLNLGNLNRSSQNQ